MHRLRKIYRRFRDAPRDLLPPGTKLSLFIHGALLFLLGGDLNVENHRNFLGPVWAPAIKVLPIHLWGVIFILAAMLCLVPALHGEKRLAQLGLAGSAALTIFMGGCWLQAGLGPSASCFTAILLFGLTARAMQQIYTIERYQPWRPGETITVKDSSG